ncbi:platelet-activating factor acetylhydrolase 2, cytoplasmic isoform X1 [Melospiza melodia melodia]|uniref:platelet-activating factor acetylhydrolase 2, cytoplasmic isoform X1 n=1 Tax=Melospiza melodia melodia TaxID=1914991 RepID=UPI002FD3C799
MGAMLALPPGQGPHQVGCTDVMVGHTRQGLFLRLFYPCLARAGAAEPLWVPRPEYCGGLADVTLGRRWCSALLGMAIGSCRVPVSWNGPLKPCSRGYPLIIFSHGLGTFRTSYSSICTELASWGFVVAALEHRDHSAATTYFCPAEAGTEEWIPFQRVPQGQKEFYFRNKQVHQRARECVRALRLFQGIAGGRAAPAILPQDWDLSVLKDNLDLSKVAVMGHSFGGVTAVLALVKEPRFRCAVALDAWMFPLENLLYPEVPSPVLFINTEHFQSPESAAKMRSLSSRNSQTRIGHRARGPERPCLPPWGALQPHLRHEGQPGPSQGSDHHQPGCSGLPAETPGELLWWPCHLQGTLWWPCELERRFWWPCQWRGRCGGPVTFRELLWWPCQWRGRCGGPVSWREGSGGPVSGGDAAVALSVDGRPWWPCHPEGTLW